MDCGVFSTSNTQPEQAKREAGVVNSLERMGSTLLGEQKLASSRNWDESTRGDWLLTHGRVCQWSWLRVAKYCFRWRGNIPRVSANAQ